MADDGSLVMDEKLNEKLEAVLDDSYSQANISKLPGKAVEQIFAKLSVAERVLVERVSPQWRSLVQDFGWSKQAELSAAQVFMGEFGASRRDRFNNQCLIALFDRVGPALHKLDVGSFGGKDDMFSHAQTIGICGRLHLLPNLSILHLGEMVPELQAIVHFLPSTLRELQLTTVFSEQSLSTLAIRCPNLNAIMFDGGKVPNGLSVQFMNTFIGRYPGLKKLWLRRALFNTVEDEENSEQVASIGELHELEELNVIALTAGVIDDNTFRAIIAGNRGLRRVSFNGTLRVSEQALFALAELPALVELLAWYHPTLTDSVLKAIARRGILKKLDVMCSKVLTDDAIVFMIQHCKQLVTLNVVSCEQLTDRCLTAVLTEVFERHGMYPVTVPKHPLDEGIFVFPCVYTKFWEAARFALGFFRNPWFSVEYNTDLLDRKFDV